jgi:membrane associated rhomboid family serine protease
MKVWQQLKRVHSPVTASLLLVNLLVYLYQSLIGPEAFVFTLQYAAIPERVAAALHWIRVEGPTWENLEPLGTLFSATLLHASETHLGNNMLFLWVFGSLVEQILGKLWIVPLFFLTGGIGNLAQAYLNPGSPVPVIGASGGVAGLGAVYLVLALRWELPWPHVWPMSRAVPPGQLAAMAAVGFLLDVLSLGDSLSNVAYGAHVGGFFTGITVTLILTSLRRPPPRLVRER